MEKHLILYRLANARRVAQNGDLITSCARARRPVYPMTKRPERKNNHKSSQRLRNQSLGMRDVRDMDQDQEHFFHETPFAYAVFPNVLLQEG